MRKLVAVLCLATCAGCGAAHDNASNPPSAAVAPSKASVRPLLLPRQLGLPEPTELADARGTAVLRVPLDLRATEPVARAFFDAVLDENLPQLSALFVSSGGQFLSGGLGAATPVEMWRQRFRLYDYGKLRGQSFVRFEDATLLRRADYEKKDLSITVDDGDVFVRVPVSVPQGQGEPVLGTSVTLLLRRTNGSTKIVAYDEGRNQ